MNRPGSTLNGRGRSAAIAAAALLLMCACGPAALTATPIPPTESPGDLIAPPTQTAVLPTLTAATDQDNPYATHDLNFLLTPPAGPTSRTGIFPFNNGATFTFGLTERFTVELDEANHPGDELKCTPDGIIAYVSNGSAGPPGVYPERFEAVGRGTCQLTDRDFQVTIVVNG